MCADPTVGWIEPRLCSEGAYEEAAKAYEKANDLDSVVRLLLGQLNQAPRAMAIVRETKSPQGALLVAQHAQVTPSRHLP